MPWCAVKGSFYLAYGRKDATSPGKPNPLNDFGLTGTGNGVVLVFDIEKGEVDKKSDIEKDVDIKPADQAIVGLIVDLPASGTKKATLYIPNSNSDIGQALDALFNTGWPGTNVKNVFAAINDGGNMSLKDATVSVSQLPTFPTSSITITIENFSNNNSF